MFRILLIVSLFSQLSFAQNTVTTQEKAAVALNDNIALVAWKGFKNMKDYGFTYNMFCRSDGAFCVKPDNYVTIDVEASFPDKFAEKIKEAVDKIKDKDNPILIVFLFSHGGSGFICQEEQDNIKYDEFVDTLFKNSFGVNEDITVILFVSACYSGSIIPIIQKKLSCDGSKEGCSFEGTTGGRYKNKMSVYSAAPADKTTTGFAFLTVLNTVTKLQDCKDKDICGLNDAGTLAFLSLDDDNNDYVFWSSFSGKDERLSSNGDKSIPIKLLANSDPEVRRVAAFALSKKAFNGDKDAIEALIYTLKNDKEPDVRSAAGCSLTFIDQGGKDTIEALIYTLKNDKAFDVRIAAAYYLVNVAQGDKVVILDAPDLVGPLYQVLNIVQKYRETVFDALICALKNDDNPTVRQAVANTLEVAQGDKNVIAALIYVLKNDSDAAVRSSSAEVLGKVAQNDKKTTRALIYSLKNDPDFSVRKIAADVLIQTLGGNTRGYKKVIKALKYTEML